MHDQPRPPGECLACDSWRAEERATRNVLWSAIAICIAALCSIVVLNCAHTPAAGSEPSPERLACLIEAKAAAWSDAESACDLETGAWEDCPERQRILDDLELAAARCPP